MTTNPRACWFSLVLHLKLAANLVHRFLETLKQSLIVSIAYEHAQWVSDIVDFLLTTASRPASAGNGTTSFGIGSTYQLGYPNQKLI